MSRVTLQKLFAHPEINKYLRRSGVHHAVCVTEYAYTFALNTNVNPDLATKAALLHDIGHYTWYTNGQWDYQIYKQNDIHAIKGANRAHKYLIQMGEEPKNAKEIALAILLHTDSYLPIELTKRTPLQEVITLADEADEEPGGTHHYRQLSQDLALYRLRILDQKLTNHHLGDVELA